MAFNYNYVPWLSFLGIIGAAIGYVVGGAGSGPQSMSYALMGLLGGTVTGMLVRIVFRYRGRYPQAPKEALESPTTMESPDGAPSPDKDKPTDE